MAEGNDEPEVKHSRASLPFLEVLCRSSGKIRRFSAGTEAGFAVDLINRKLAVNGGAGTVQLASHIEAVKEGEEEPVSFGPSSVLVDYGSAWKLQTVAHSSADKGGAHTERVEMQTPYAKGFRDSRPARIRTQTPISLVYVAKILLAFVLIFMFGAAITLGLENLPRFILYINSSV